MWENWKQTYIKKKKLELVLHVDMWECFWMSPHMPHLLASQNEINIFSRSVCKGYSVIRIKYSSWSLTETHSVGLSATRRYPTTKTGDY